jgi:uncharacterized paraquat-inducible protein A
MMPKIFLTMGLSIACLFSFSTLPVSAYSAGDSVPFEAMAKKKKKKGGPAKPKECKKCGKRMNKKDKECHHCKVKHENELKKTVQDDDSGDTQ